MTEVRNKYTIKRIVEQYFDSTEQMNQILKTARKVQAAAEKNKEIRAEFIQNILGKNTYRKYDKSGLFAPVPLSALKLTFKDFSDLNPNFDVPVEKVEKLIDIFHEKFYKYKDFTYGDDHDAPIRTNIVFSTIDDIINFFFNILNVYNRVYHTEDINWKPIVKKFRTYLN